jgi:plastocyanin
VWVTGLTTVVMIAMPLLAGWSNVAAKTQQPATVTVAAGTTVTWTNRDDIPHTVVSADDPKVLKSKVLDTDEKFSYTFAKAGTYPSFCSIHPKMTGKVEE